MELTSVTIENNLEEDKQQKGIVQSKQAMHGFGFSL